MQAITLAPEWQISYYPSGPGGQECLLALGTSATMDAAHADFWAEIDAKPEIYAAHYLYVAVTHGTTKHRLVISRREQEERRKRPTPGALNQ